MSVVEESMRPSRASAWRPAMLQRALTSPRLPVYLSCTLLAVLTSWLLGKDMQWDTLHYHLYAGFSAIHDRFGVDYFAAGVQSYLNPYIYAPFYLLATSGLTALETATIFAVIHGAILWLSYELAIVLVPCEQPRTRIAVGVCAALLAFANPVLIDQLGSSYADITTAELVLAGCLLLLGALRAPSVWRIVAAGVLLGAASALKLTNVLAAASLALLPLFLPVDWRKRLGHTGLLGFCIAAGFVLVSAPWSIRLEQHFGNPFFPLFNGLFRSPQYTTGPDTDSLFIPPTLGAALWRPFAMVTPVRMVHVEMAAPDLRYAILLLAAAISLGVWSLRRLGAARLATEVPAGGTGERAVLALGCVFLVDWVLWLSMSGNSRYFLPMACVAAALSVALIFRLMGRWPRLRNCVVAAVLVVQIYQVDAGAVLRPPLPWNRGPWFEVSVPAALAGQPNLYFSTGIQTNAFAIPFLAPGSGFINLEGDFVLGPDGANGAYIHAMIRRFSPHLRVLVFDPGVTADRDTRIPHQAGVDDALEPFGLRVDATDCVKIVVPDAPTVQVITFGRAVPNMPLARWYTRYLISCRAVPNGLGFGAVPPSERSANRVLDRLEDDCPAVLQPRRSVTFLLNGRNDRGMWVRRYSATHVSAWVSDDRLIFQAMLGRDREHDLGSVDEWERAPPRVACGRTESGQFFLRVLRPH